MTVRLDTSRLRMEKRQSGVVGIARQEDVIECAGCRNQVSLINCSGLSLLRTQPMEVNIMPRGDGTGPAGQGPMTGRAAGYCAGYNSPGYANPGWGRASMAPPALPTSNAARRPVGAPQAPAAGPRYGAAPVPQGGYGVPARPVSRFAGRGGRGGGSGRGGGRGAGRGGGGRRR